MKVLFVHSVRFVRTPDGRVFAEGQFSYEGWTRYLKYFDELTVAGRMSERTTVPEKWNLSSGPRVTFIGTPDDHGQRLKQLQQGEARSILKKAVANCDAVIVRQSQLGWVAAQQARRAGVPWAVEVVCNSWDSYWNYGALAAKLYAPVAEWKSRYWIKRAGFAIYVTQEYLQRRYPCRGFSCGVSDVEVGSETDVPNGVEKKITRWKTRDKDGAKPFIVGLIGDLFHRGKGLHVAMRAMRRLRDQGILVHLRVLGSGPQDGWLSEARQIGVEDLLFLNGSLPSGGPVKQWLDDLDIYIQPSFTEGLPRALIEAMSRGLPALGSKVAGIPELLASECLHRPGDDKTLAQQLARMVQDSSWRLQQAQRNWDEAQNFCGNRLQARRDAFWNQFSEYVMKIRKN
ncbi:MAG: glycosyltransferase [Candidatus Omnitrophota bacterium]